ncbi:DUF1998 domain-containing protein [Hyphobacterium sp. SN044]|uniref:DUF1998 domain-containing protein n=1 Tax=Hyphobacterium sp. SN044 TaxID=2912575 RepID=UPI001F3D2C8D|nr:DUF1998 domain-containing protein [Hyphobacterium sp. SN044]MCF8879661.1 DUF1998 domain-containing protein [Hyphobacterium sp. SN044]
MAEDEIRLAQLIQTFGPGSIVDLPKSSVMIRGLGSWPKYKPRKIRERRLVYYLKKLLENAEGGSWLAEDAELELWEPPLNEEAVNRGDAPAIPAVIFPRWVTVTHAGATGAEATKQKLERYTANERQRKNTTKTPVRWVGACKNGHVQDIDWRWFVHVSAPDKNCQQDMWLEDRSSGSDPQYIDILCDCGARRPLSELYAGAGTLGPCVGRRSWLEGKRDEGCDETLVPMTRGAINNYYSQILSLIALPEDPDDLEMVIAQYPRLKSAENVSEVAIALKFSEEDVRQAFSGYSHEEIWKAIQTVRAKEGAEAAASPIVQHPKEAEFELFASAPKIGSDGLNARLTGWRVPRPDWIGRDIIDTGFIRDIVAMSRLCVVTALYGFTRLEPANSPFDETFEEINLQVRGQPLDEQIRWLPAMEQFGEGFFLQIDPDWFSQKLDSTHARTHFEKVEQRYLVWKQKQPDRSEYPGHAYVFAHSLSHMLMEQIALDAGYPSTSLSERIYALSSPGASRISKIGVLIYAAGSGSQGTLGGLLQLADRVPELVRRGLERIEICGNDPICSTSPTPIANDDFSGFGASCHGCLFTAETSCEKRNMLLDRKSLFALLNTA